MDFKTLHKQRLYVMAAALLGVIAMILPWVKVPFLGSVNGLRGNGIIVFLGFIAAGVLAFMGDQKLPLPKSAWLGVLGAGALCALFWLINLLRIPSGGMKFIAIGFWICIIAAIGVIGAAYMFRGAGQDLKQSLNEMKKNVSNKLDGDPNT